MIVTGISRDVLALAVARQQVSPKELRDALGFAEPTIRRAVKELEENEFIEVTGTTSTRRIAPTEHGKKAYVRVSDDDGAGSTKPISSYAGGFDMDVKVRALGARARSNGSSSHSNTVTTRQATPAELQRAATPPAPAKIPITVELDLEPEPTASSDAQTARIPEEPTLAPAAAESVEDEFARPGRPFTLDDEPDDLATVATLDDVALAREQLRALYTQRLIAILTPATPEHIYDRVERILDLAAQ